MFKINVVCIGKIKESYYSQGIEEYSKRLSRFCEFKIIELQEENYQKVDESIKAIIMEKEAERIIPYLKGKVYSLAIEGKQFSSHEFSALIKKEGDLSGVITFVIGGSYGLSDRVKALSNALLSFSKLTFPHTLFRLMLTEQIYRAFSIINEMPYHK